MESKNKNLLEKPLLITQKWLFAFKHNFRFPSKASIGASKKMSVK